MEHGEHGVTCCFVALAIYSFVKPGRVQHDQNGSNDVIVAKTYSQNRFGKNLS